MKLSKPIVLAALVVLAVLAAAWFWGGDHAAKEAAAPIEQAAAPAAQPAGPPPETAPEVKPEVVPQPEPEPAAEPELPSPPPSEPEPEVAPESEPVATAAEPEAAPITQLSCTISITCTTILDNISLLDGDKQELIPENGVILPAISMAFEQGESVFDILQRACREQGVHLEFVTAPGYDTAYIEGINNIYEFDCGELSGWMYRVNGLFPNYGCSLYFPVAGDEIEFIYSCDLGRDIGAPQGGS